MTHDACSNQFVAIDFETANADLSSVCQVGIVKFKDNKIIESWGSLVNPEAPFDWINVDVHGIDEETVKDAPTFGEIQGIISSMLSHQIVVSHTSFDRAVLHQALDRYKSPLIPCTWLDSARVVRRTWEKWSQKGYGLGNVCKELKISFKAHDAIEDARAAGEVLIQAMNVSCLGLGELLERVKRPILDQPIALKGDPAGAMFGEELVFTGSLTIPRREAAALAARIGCDVTENVKKTTKILVVGDQDILKLAGHEKSIKHRKAEQLIEKGHPIRILRETDFLRLVETA